MSVNERPSVDPVSGSGDAVLDALDAVLLVGRSNVTAWMAVMERIEQVRRHRAAGWDYTGMPLPQGMRLVDVLAENQERLNEATRQLRDALVVQLRREGLSIADIARLFSVSRQWVSRLLRDLDPQPELSAKCPTNQTISDATGQ